MTITAWKYFLGREEGASIEEEAAFYGSLKMRNGTFKSTRSRRFADLDPLVVQHAPVLANERLQILDVAVSAGMSTVELADAFRAAGRAQQVTATDLFIDARLIAIGPRLRVLADRQGWPLQYDLAGIALRPWIRRLDYLTLAVLPLRLAHALAASELGRRIERGQGHAVRLVCRQLTQLPDARLVEQDIFEASQFLARRFHVVRAANILNRNYFEQSRIEIGVRNLVGYLHGPGSILVISRTDDRTRANNASLFKLDQSGLLVPVVRAGKGSEIEETVLQISGS